VNAFIVDLKNKPGELAKVTEALAAKGIDLRGVAGATCGDSGSLTLITNDEAGTKRVLTDGQWKYRPVELVTAELADRPGTFAQAARSLADAGINVEAALPTGMAGGKIQVAFATDNPVRAREALGEGQLAGARR
jgi:hypothetical protein